MLLNRTIEELENLEAINTAKEIHQQPRKWRELAQSLVEQKAEIEAFVNKIGKPDLRVILTGAGTSEFAGTALALHLDKKCRFTVESIATTDLVSNPEEHLDASRPTLLVSLARSGNSPESLASKELADQCIDQIYHLILTCNKDGALAKSCKGNDNELCIIMPPGTNDLSFAMTSSCTCMQLSALIILSESIDKCIKQVEVVASICESQFDEMHKLACNVAALDFERLIYIGSGDLKGTAQEAALKLLELSAGKVATYFDSSLSFRHGPKFTINEKAVVIHMLSPAAYTNLYDVDLANELIADDVAMKVVTLSTCPTEKFSSPSLIFDIPNLAPVWANFPYLLFAQLLGFEKSIERGLSPDNPCPSGEVNRVVQGVIIHKYN
ncbi:SIS domain-containing protein [Vibrio sp. Hep-1b-8]|uniref:SIS domain-containing protein n=1 Tax=Vibrio sp. Hep-1b-8 TaxID=2144187 RepID=UPI0011109E52|nr:SIS domain-containing protein [Vibrio sp. Hep-1b-8]TMX44561.1 tagatose-6-phosphate ketose isomerase [Vibrio sp. Hep-1b-8]